MVDPDSVLPPAVPVGRDSTAGVAVLAHLRRQSAALMAADADVEAGDEDAVHGARVAARRLRSGLRVYGHLLRDDVSARLRPELAWYAGTLSPARDLEVFAERLRDEDEATAEALLPWVDRRLAQAVRTAVEESRSERAAALRGSLVELARAPRFVDAASRRASKVLAPLVLRADERAATKLETLRTDDDSHLWHTARIAAKRARYAAEVGAPAIGKPGEELAKLWSTLTEPLGDSQDAVIQRGLVLDRVDDAAVPLSAGEAFVCGVFVAGTYDRERELHRRAHRIWNDSRDEHRRLRRSVRS
ncbi:MAG TPA: CHAD domain-containing protein [Candidatus Nanopelagicales bacterium]|nr:CHAD domain-containing protein [Candidatus Nanopelagicales bacterium]